MKITAYDANGIPITSGLSSLTFTATPTSVFDASVSISGGVATIALSMDNQIGNVVLASPSDGSSNTPGFRSLVAADIPNLSGAKITSGAINNIPVGTTTASDGYFSSLRLIIATKAGIFTHANSADRTYTLPNYDGTLATLAGTETLTNKTIGVSQLSGAISEVNGGTNQTTYTQGDTLYASAANTLAKLAKGLAFQHLQMNAAGTLPEWGETPYILLQDQKSQNTAGGTFTTGAWQTRTLNTEVSDIYNLCTLSSNQITLAAGIYEVFWVAAAYQVNKNLTRLFNVTDNVVVSGTWGTTAQSENITNGNIDYSFGFGRFTIAASKALELQHQCSTTIATNGFGLPSNFSTEVYASILFKRVSS